MSIVATTFAAALMATAPLQEAPDGDWVLDPEALGDEWSVADAYLVDQRERCEASDVSQRQCLSIVYRHIYIAQIFGEYLAAARLAEQWLEAAEPLGLLGGEWELVARYRLGYSAIRIAESGDALPRPALQLAIEQLSMADDLAEGIDESNPWLVNIRRSRSDALGRLAYEQVFDERRIALWRLAADDLAAAISLMGAMPGEFSDYDRADLQADLSRAMLELDIGEEAALAADAAIASFRKVVAAEPGDVRFIAPRVRQLAQLAQEAGFPKLAIAYYGFVLDMTELDNSVLFSVSDLLTLCQAYIDNGEPDLAVETYAIALQDPGFTRMPSNEAFLRAGLLRAMVATEDFERIPQVAEQSIAFADAAIAAGEYEAPLNAMKMHARAAWGSALVAQGRWAEAEPILKESREYRVRMAFRDPTDPREITGDLLLAKAISRGSGDFRTARSLLKSGMDAAVVASERGTGFDTGSQAVLRSYAPLFREQVRIAFALAKPEQAPR